MESIDQKRIYSFLTDCIISNFIGFFIFSFLNIERDFKLGSFDFFGINFNYGLTFQIFIIVIYFILFDMLNKGKTFGKLIFSINVVNKNDLESLNTSKLLMRTFYKTLAILILPISIILYFIYNGFTIQDKICQTTTIN